jgi:phage shock protein PspC (stress-responsive transcriptional regulator)
MDKTININIAGTLFQIDEEAFRTLRDYLQAINNRFRNVKGGLETIEDIESRIAEIFQSQKGLAGVITKDNVEAMISIIGKPEDFDHVEAESVPQFHSDQRKRMYRNPNDSIISGVCGGLGVYLNTDPVVFRILFVLFTVFFGVGFLVYIALWISLLPANTDERKREMYGHAYDSYRSQNRQHDSSYTTGASSYNTGHNNAANVGNALNEVFRALARVFYIAIRIILIIIGITIVLSAFFTILSFFAVFVFKYPGFISTDGFDANLINFPDFLNYIVNPALAPWIIVLALITFILPMLALIYWGVKMIFWFRAKDGVFSLVGLILWVVTIAALSMILFSEGISFAKTAKSSSQNIFTHSPDTLYIKADKKVSDLKFDKELSLKRKGYNVFINEEKKELYIRPYFNVINSDNDAARVEVKKRSAGRTEIEAANKTEGLLFNYSLSADTLRLDEYFTIPSGRKWSADNVGINLYLKKGTVLKFDQASENLFHTHSYGESEENFTSKGKKSGNRSWILTDEGLKAFPSHSAEQK